MGGEQPVRLRFTWDPRKNQQNIRKHGFDFADVHNLFAVPMLVALDDREEYGEDRWIGIGLLHGRAVVVVYTERDDTTIRIISLRKALSHERAGYDAALRNRLGAN